MRPNIPPVAAQEAGAPTVITYPSYPTEIIPKPIPDYVIDLRGQILNRTMNVVNETGYGALKELLLRSTTANYTLVVRRDGSTVIEKTWADYSSDSKYLIDIDAFQDAVDGSYILKLSNISFTQSLQVTLIPIMAVTFSIIFAKYSMNA
jgi:hypothetical protein